MSAKRVLSAILAAGLVVGTAGAAHAGTVAYLTTSGDYATANNWTPSGVPGAGYDSAIVGDSAYGAHYATLASDVTGGGTPSALYVGFGGGGTLTFNSGASLSVGSAYVGCDDALAAWGNPGNGTVVHNAGAVTAGSLLVAAYTGDRGAYSMGGGSLSVSGLFDVGEYGSGTFTQSGGAVAASNAVSVGAYAGGAGTLTVGGGSFASGQVVAGDYGTGLLGLAGGSLNTGASHVTAGNQSGAVGTFNMSGNSLLTGNGIVIGESSGSAGMWNMSGGAANLQTGSGSCFIVCHMAGSSGTVTQTGGSITTDYMKISEGNLAVGGGITTGLYNLSGGNLNVVWWTLFIGCNAGATGTLNIGGGTLTALDVDVGAGSGANGYLSLTSGMLTSSGTVYVGSHGTGASSVSGGTMTVAGDYYIGGDGDATVNTNTGTLNITGGSITVAGHNYIGEGAGSSGTVTMSQPATWNAAFLQVGRYGSGTFNQSAGRVATLHDCIVGANTNGSGVYNLTGGTLSVGGSGDLILADGTGSTATFIQNGGVVDTTSATTYGGLWVGNDVSTGTYHLINGSVTTLGMLVGSVGAGTFTQDGGTVTVTTAYTGSSYTQQSAAIPLGQAGIGAESAAVGIYNLNGGVLNLAPSFGIAIGVAGTGTLNFNGGVANLGGGTISGDSTATFNFKGGTLNNVGLVSTPITLVSGGTGPVFEEDSGYSGTVTGNINGSAGLTKTGAGTLYFAPSAGSNSYGMVVVKGGTLDLAKTAQDTVTSMDDIQAGQLIFDYTNAGDDPSSAIAAILKASHAAGWTVTASHPIGSTTATDGLHALGWLDDTAHVKVDIMYTLYGDANLDGSVNGADLNTVLSNYNLTGMTWSQGDFNYDGTVNGADLNVVLSNYNQSLSVGAAVPEPSTIVLLLTALAAVACLAPMRRSR